MKRGEGTKVKGKQRGVAGAEGGEPGEQAHIAKEHREDEKGGE